MSSTFVAMRTSLLKDERLAVLADIGGYDVDAALGKLFRLWGWCADRRLQDAPDGCKGHAVSEAVVRRFMGPRGVEAMLADGCDELALGARFGDGLIYLRGSEECVARLRAHAKAASAGGKARSESPRESGRFVVETTNHQPATSGTPAGDQRTHQPETSQHQRDLQITDHRSQKQDLDQQPRGELVPAASRPKARSPRPVKASLPDGWKPARNHLNHEAEQAAIARGVDLEHELKNLRDWATSNAAKKFDWDATWRNWTRNAKPLSGRSQAPNRNPSRVALDELRRLEREEQLAKERIQ